jgi:murein DD-endopeptidase MepM/ murein hydrolase activator NlpD
MTIGVAAIGVGYGIRYKTELQDEIAANKQLGKKVERYDEEMRGIQKEMRDIREMAGTVRHVLGLDREKGIIGQGGDGFDAEEVNHNEQTNSIPETQPAIMAIYTDLSGDSPIARIVQLKSEIEPIYGHVKGKIKEFSETPSILPIDVPIDVPADSETPLYWYSSQFGWRPHPLTKKRHFHRGLDIASRKGTPVIATANGVVTQAEYDRYLGNMVQITHQTHQSTQIKTLYGHLKKHADGIRVGKKVKRGETIGYVGNTGKSTGTHLHYGVYTKGKWRNPKNYILDDSRIR